MTNSFTYTPLESGRLVLRDGGGVYRPYSLVPDPQISRNCEDFVWDKDQFGRQIVSPSDQEFLLLFIMHRWIEN